MAPSPVPTCRRPDILSGLSLVLKVALVVTLVVTAGFAGLGSTGDAESRPRLVEVLIFSSGGFIAFGSTTLAFAALDLWRSRFLPQTSWDPVSCELSYDSKSRVQTRLADRAGACVCRASVAVARALLSDADFGRRRSRPRAHVSLERRLRADGCLPSPKLSSTQ